MKIENNKYVAVTYNLIVGEAEGDATVMESATANRPLEFIPGLGMMLPKFEENLLGLEQGAKFDFTMLPEDAYGQRDPERPVPDRTGQLPHGAGYPPDAARPAGGGAL